MNVVYSLAAMTVVAGIFGAVSYGVHTSTQDVVIATVLDKERVTNSYGKDAQSKFLVFTDVETFENTDSIWALKWNSSDIYGRIERNATCRFEVVGFRVPFLSMYRNILSADCD